jgi:hypothetical protein
MSACDTLTAAYGDEFETFINSKVEEPHGAELASAKERGLYSWTQRPALPFPFARPIPFFNAFVLANLAANPSCRIGFET